MNSREQAARGICEVLRVHGYQSLFAGGCVRDMVLGETPRDYDIATDAPVDVVAGLFPKTFGVGAAFGVVLVLLPEGKYEVATFRSDGPYEDGRRPVYVRFSDAREDALRRDFTINALFLDPVTNQVIDYVDGLGDLKAKRIRTVGDPEKRFSEDYLRLLRAVRFSARLGYEIVPETARAICSMAPLVCRTSAERIRDELLKMLTEGGARRALFLLDELGLLPHVLPEVAAMKGVQQPQEFHPEGDVFEHTLKMLGCMEAPSPVLAMAVLLHDVGKPQTQTFEDRIRFNFHDKVGARLVEVIGRRLRLPREMIEQIVWLVEQHMRLVHIRDMRESKRKRLIREPGFSELLSLARWDCLASHGDTAGIDWIEDYVAGLAPEQARPAPLLRGDDLIALGYSPGPIYSEILREVEDAQLEGKLTDRASAEAYVRRTWPLPGTERIV